MNLNPSSQSCNCFFFFPFLKKKKKLDNGDEFCILTLNVYYSFLSLCDAHLEDVGREYILIQGFVFLGLSVVCCIDTDDMWEDFTEKPL